MEVREAGDGAASGEIVRVPPKKYTWAEVRQAVHDLRKELSSLSTMVPMAISFRKLANGKFRIYFLRTPQNGWEITLLYTDIILSSQPNSARLEWKPLIESNVALGVTSGKWSREEQLLWERQRVCAWGIASYELHNLSGRVLFPCASSLFVCEESDTQSPPLIPRSLSTGGGAPLTPAMCPTQPDLVAHAARQDIWLCGGGLRRPARLTYACKGHDVDRLADDPRQAGVPCYVTQEEFSRYTGFWWQPTANDGVYRIVYEEVDESEVKIFSFPSSQTSSGDVEEFRFPRAGTANAKSYLKLVTFRLQKASPATVLDYYNEGSDNLQDSSSSDSMEVTDIRWFDLRQSLKDTFPWFEYLARVGWTPCGNYDVSDSSSSDSMEVTDIRWFDLRQSLKDTFPWFEYLARVGWTPCGNYVWAQLLDRKQQRLELVLIPLCEWSHPFVYEHAPTHFTVQVQDDCLLDKQTQVLLTESAPDAWINVHDVLYFLPADSGQLKFIWASEETGHLHLYLITCGLHTGSRQRASSVIHMITEDETNAIAPNIISKETITSGEWEIMGKKIWVDESRQLVYFVGLRETPLERHLYCASLTSPHTVSLLSSPGHSCTVDIDQDCSIAVITTSNISCVPSTRVYRIVHTPATALLAQGTLMERSSSELSDTRSFNGSWDSRSGDGDDTDCGDTTILIRESSLSALDIPPPQIYSCRLCCGLTAYCTLWRCGTSGRSPTVLHVYGGPEVQTVTNTYKGIRQLRMHMLAARGFNVVAIDSRGSKHRGRAWEAAIKGKMGQVELDDQVEVLQWLAKETGCIDMERIAIHGWSYGGYLSLLGLATRPNIFKVCVAGAPVTCWRLYDTAYTERYMGLPGRSPHAYTRASVLKHAPFFPDQSVSLFCYSLAGVTIKSVLKTQHSKFLSQEGRLLIIHGLADENVHFCHTAALLAELVRLGKPHRVQIYPGERHSLRAMHAAKHYEATLLHFLHENL